MTLWSFSWIKKAISKQKIKPQKSLECRSLKRCFYPYFRVTSQFINNNNGLLFEVQNEKPKKKEETNTVLFWNNVLETDYDGWEEKEEKSNNKHVWLFEKYSVKKRTISFSSPLFFFYILIFKRKNWQKRRKVEKMGTGHLLNLKLI